jgi:hypothetical protein
MSEISKLDLLNYAISVGERMSKEYIESGDYYPKEAWGCEGQIYPSSMGLALLNLHKLEQREIFIEAVKIILTTNIRKQMPSGGWALSLGAAANGIRFKVSPDIMKASAAVEDLPSTVVSLRLIAEYRKYTADKSFDGVMNKTYKFLLKYWNNNIGAFDEILTGDTLKLRANPKNYHIYVYQCMLTLTDIYEDAKLYISPLYKLIKDNFEAMNADTYTLLYALHAAQIVMTEQESDYVITEVKRRITDEIAVHSRFNVENVPGAMGHHDGLRGICLDEGHLRNSVGAALAMSFYDKYTGVKFFTINPHYTDLTNWICSMYSNGRFYEFLDIKTGNRMGLGTPGQFIPLFWILGKI